MSLRARLRRLRRLALAVGSTLVIVLGVLAGLMQLALPWIERHPQHVEAFLSRKLGKAVAIDGVKGAWVGGGPLLELQGVRIAGSDPASPLFTVPRAGLAFNPWALFRRDHAVTEFRIGGLELRLVRREGTWRLLGPDLPEGGDEPFSMGALGAIEIHDSTVTLESAEHDLDFSLRVPVLRLLNRGAITHLVGRVSLPDDDAPPLELVADVDINRRSGEFYVGARRLDLARASARQTPGGVVMAGGRGDLQLWLRMQSARVDDVRLRVDLRDARFGAAQPIVLEGRTPLDAPVPVSPRAAFDRLAFVARWLRHDDGWDLDIADFLADAQTDAMPARVSIEQRGRGDAASWRAGAQAVSLEPLGNLAMLSGTLPEGLRRWLYLAHPRGMVEDAHLRWSGMADHDFDARLRGIELSHAGRVPGIGTFDADLSGDAQAMLMALPRQPLRIDWPRVFRKPFLFSELGGDIVAYPVEDAFRIDTDSLAFEGEGYGGEVRGGVELRSGRRPFVDLAAVVTHAKVVAAKLFWPTTDMSPAAIAWLDRGLVDGRVAGGRAVLRGDLADWPFRNDAGRFLARAELEDTQVLYDANWPRVDKLRAVATFLDNGMQVDIASAQTMGVSVGESSAAIPDFRDLLLDVVAKGEGSGSALLAYLRATPIGKRNADALKGLDIGGKGVLALKLQLPIAHVENLSLDGSVDLTAAKIDQPAWDLHFTAASGRIRFNQGGVSADRIDATYRERPVVGQLAIGNAVADPRNVLEAGVGGRFPVTTVFADVPVILPALTRVTGESEWRVDVDIESDANGGRKWLALGSDLGGTTIDLPAPLGKDAATTLPFALKLELPYDGKSFDASLGNVVALNARLPDGLRPFAANLQFGAREAAAAPAQGVTIGGRATSFDAGGWIDLARAGSGSGSGVLNGIDLGIDDFLIGSRGFGPMQLTVGEDASGTRIGLDGEAVAGRLLIPSQDLARKGITAEFRHIHWPDPPESTPGMPPEDEVGALDGADPANMPPLHVKVDDFRLGNASFGSAELESQAIPGGMRIERIETRSPNITMKAHGDWTGRAGTTRSKLTIELSAQDLGQMMGALGFPGVLEGGTTRATIDASWPGPPSAFALSRLDGTLAVDVGEGRFPDMEPGAGRLFGLLSLTEIPRRLTLDFSDFFRSGLSFNSIKGRFTLRDGNAWTDGVAINSPAADILVTGRTGLRTKDYDQQMTVSPRAGAALPVVGAIAGGPVGAAAGLVIQGILHKPLGRVIQMRYRVGGSWDEPKITEIDRETREVEQKNPPKTKGLR